MATMQEMTETAFGRELVIDRKAIKPFAKRTNCAGLIHFTGHMGLLVLTGMLAHGIVVLAAIAHKLLFFNFSAMRERSIVPPTRTIA